MNPSIYISPKDLTSSMKKYQSDFDKKSNPISIDEKSLLKDLDKTNVLEWDDGWAQFKVTEERLLIVTMFSKKGTKFKFDHIHNLAKKLNKKEIYFETERNPEAWIKLINRAAIKLNKPNRAKLKSYIIGIEV